MQHAHLLEIIHYDRETGVFTWKVKGYKRRIGKVVGGISKSIGYVEMRIDGKLYRGHRLAWFYVTGEWPPHEVDHKNLNRSDNRWENLRPATHSQNNCNRGARVDSQTGVKGVSWHKGCQKWVAQIGGKGKKYLGLYETIEAASAAYRAEAARRQGEFACL